MDKQLQALQQNLEAAAQRADAQGIEFWFARDLQAHLGYARWENFQTAIQRAMESCEATGHAVSDHFRGVTKMVGLGSGSRREIDRSHAPAWERSLHRSSGAYWPLERPVSGSHAGAWEPSEVDPGTVLPLFPCFSVGTIRT